MPRLPYLTRRAGGRFYLQIRMPPGSAWPRLLRLSLGTNDPKIARRSLCHALVWLMSFRDADTVRQQADEILTQCRKFNRSGPAATWEEIDDRQRFFTTFKQFATEVVFYNVPEKTRLDLVEEWRFFGQMLDEDRARLYRGAALGPTSQTTFQTNEPEHETPASTSTDEAFNSRAPAPQPSKRRGAKGALKASAVLKKFLIEKRQKDGNDKAYGDVGIYVEFMIELLGDKPMVAYTRDDFSRLGRELANVPDRKGLPKAARATVFTRWKFAQKNGWENLKRLSETSVRDRYGSGLSRFFRWCELQGFVSSPIRFSIVMSDENLAPLPRDAFTDEEIELILRMPTFTGQDKEDRWSAGDFLLQDHIYWGYIIMLLTGMRTSEVGQLKISDLIEAEGFYFFDLRPFDPAQGRIARKNVKKLKTGNAARFVPLDLLIIDLGLLERVQRVKTLGETRLFPEWESYTRKSGVVVWDRPLSRDWQERRKKLKLERLNISLYSSRHCMGDRLDKAEFPQRLRDRIMGHAPAHAKGRYGAKRPADPELAKLLQSLETPAVALMRSILMPPFEKAERGELKFMLPQFEQKLKRRPSPNKRRVTGA